MNGAKSHDEPFGELPPLCVFRKVQFSERKPIVTVVVTPGTSWSFQDVIKVKEDDKSSFTPADVIP